MPLKMCQSSASGPRAGGDWPRSTGGGPRAHRGIARLGDFVRMWVAAALARVAPENLNAVPALVAGTRDESYFVRSLSAWHLGRLGPQHPGIQAALPELRELLNVQQGV